ncbi:MAG: LysE family translocator [Rhodobacteraceae bacterium]|nr:LysE family translocator [Paracoccaceae bacterium]
MLSIQFLLTALVVVLMPGTGVVYTLAIGLGQGRAAALAAALGCTLGILPAMLAAMSGLAALMHASALVFQAVKVVGVAYLLYLAWTALRTGGALSVAPDRRRDSLSRIAGRGALLNVLNPKLSIFFLALLPPFLSGDPARATPEMALLGGVFMGLTLIVFALYGLFAAAARDRILSRAGFLRWLNRGFAAIFAALAVRLAAERA